MLETIIVLPVILLLMFFIAEAAFAYNAKQMADYAAFCAARSAAVNGFSTPSARQKMQQAAALAMVGVPTPAGSEYGQVRQFFGFSDNFLDPVRGQLGGGDMSNWLRRYASANLRVWVETPQLDGNGARRNATVEVVYVYNCLFFPMGAAVSGPVRNMLNRMAAARPGLASLYYAMANTSLNRTILVRGRAMLDYWAD